MYLEIPSNEPVMKLTGRIALTRDLNAPTYLSNKQFKKTVDSNKEAREAKECHLKTKRALYSFHGSVKAAKQAAKKDLDLQKVIKEHDQRWATLHSREEQARTSYLTRLRAKCFRDLGVRTLENQHTDQRSLMAQLHRPPICSRNVPSSCNYLSLYLRNGRPCRMINGSRMDGRLSGSMQLLATTESRRGQGEKAKVLNNEQKHEPEADAMMDIRSAFSNNFSDTFPLQSPGTQCMFCLGDDSLPVKCRGKSFKNRLILTCHVDAEHLDRFTPGESFLCGHPHCQGARFFCDDANHFKNHALEVHNVVHGVRA